MKSFSEIINEGKLAVAGNQFVVSAFYDRQGLCLSFIPHSKVLDTYSKADILEMIQKLMESKMPEIAKLFWFESQHEAAGLTFRLNISEFTEYIEKRLK